MHIPIALFLFITLTISMIDCTSTKEKLERDEEDDVFLVLLKQHPPIVHYDGSIVGLPRPPHIGLHSRRIDMKHSKEAIAYKTFLVNSHDLLLERSSYNISNNYNKLYSYYYLINGFAASMSLKQAATLSRMPEVAMVTKDGKVKKMTTYTPSYLGLPTGPWAQSSLENGILGEGIVVGLVDTGINPSHPSFSNTTSHPYHSSWTRNYNDINTSSFNSTRHVNSDTISTNHSFRGECEVSSFCNGKIVAARHFAKAAIKKGLFRHNPNEFASPLDADGHGTHTASIAVGNQGVQVKVAGVSFGNASGMAPRARLAIYKALYAGFGGFYADVVAAIDKAVEDGVDVLSLSIGPTRPPDGIATYFNVVDLALLSAIKVGVFVVQAAGNGGPYSYSIISFSPWIFTVAATLHDRTYTNSLMLGDNQILHGVGLSNGHEDNHMYPIVLANHALKNYSITKNNYWYEEECQDANKFEQGEVEGKVLVCTITFDFLIGSASIRRAEVVAKNLSAKGLIFKVSPWIESFDLHDDYIPFSMPTMIINNGTYSKRLANYINRSLENGIHQPIGRIIGCKAQFSHAPPKIASYSSRGPDPADYHYNAADVLKPNIAAPGSSIWGAWTPKGTESPHFKGDQFAVLSGTSMATPHIAGIAALIKQKNSWLSPAGIASSMATTASLTDKHGKPISVVANQYFMSTNKETEATPFDMGSGVINATAAMQPGLIFDTGYEEYVRFLCSIHGGGGGGGGGSSAVRKSVVDDGLVHNYMQVGGCSGEDHNMSSSYKAAVDLNAPYVVVARLEGARNVSRVVTHVAGATETYRVSAMSPSTASVSVHPPSFTLRFNQSATLRIALQPTTASASSPSFGRISFQGNKGHSAHIPVALISIHTPSS